MEDGNHYGRFIATVNALPTYSSTRWYAGDYASLQSSPTLPADWSLSFDFRSGNLDPIWIQISIPSSLDFYHHTVMTAWATPTSTAWNSVVLQGQQFTEQDGDGPQYETDLRLGMASHDQNGNPLAFSEVGTHELDLDNIVFEAVPEPQIFALVGVACFLRILARRR